jgi:hypothetical protein
LRVQLIPLDDDDPANAMDDDDTDTYQVGRAARGERE